MGAPSRLLSEGAVQQGWHKIAETVKAAVERDQTAGRLFTVEPRSSMARDDQRTHPVQISHLVAHQVSTSLDHLHAIVSLVVDGNLLHAHAPFTLARAAIESACTAFWLVHPPSRPERLTRSIRLRVQDINDAHLAIDPTTITPPKAREDRLAELRALVNAAGLDPGPSMNGAVSTTGIVSYADQHLGIQVLFAWQLCSGFSHGRPWAALGLLERHELESSEEGVVLMRQTSSLDRALYPTAVAFGVLNRTFALLHDRCRP